MGALISVIAFLAVCVIVLTNIVADQAATISTFEKELNKNQKQKVDEAEKIEAVLIRAMARSIEEGKIDDFYAYEKILNKMTTKNNPKKSR